jgi:HK97 family phage portal protein
LHSNDRNPWPLIGEAPLLAALDDLEMYDAIKRQQEQFFKNQARPSAVLSTDLVLDKDQVQALRDRWNEQSKGLYSGGVPILTAGLKVQPWTTQGGARDMQIAELMQYSDNRIALLYRIPLAVLGIQNTTAHNTEQLMSIWLGMGLGFCLNHIEEAIGNLFKLQGQPDEYVEFSTDALLRSARKDRIEMLVRGVQGGVFSPNEARAEEDLPAVEYGDSPRVQAQVIPLSAAGAIPTAPSAPVPEAALSAPIPRQLTKARHLGDLKMIRRRVAGGQR